MSLFSTTWKYINTHWDEQSFFQAKMAWNYVCSDLSTTSSIVCPNCNIGWNDDMHISRALNCCANCDQLWHPYLSNPKNKDLVLRYIDSKYHKYILFDYDWKTEYDMVICELRKNFK